MKKLLSLLLVLCMLLSMIPTAALAVEDDLLDDTVDSQSVTEDGDTNAGEDDNALSDDTDEESNDPSEGNTDGDDADVGDGVVVPPQTGSVSGTVTGEEFLAAQVEGVITLDGNVTLTSNVMITEYDSYTVDLNGYTITRVLQDGEKASGAPAFRVSGRGALTINDSSEDGSGQIISQGYGAVYVFDQPTVVVNGGTISAQYYAISGNGSNKADSSTVTINGGLLTSTDGLGIYKPEAGTLTIAGGEVRGLTAIGIKSGTLNVTGGKLTATMSTPYQETESSSSGINEDGSAILVDSNGSYSGEVVINICDNIYEGTEITSANGYGIKEIGNKADKTSIVSLNIEGGKISGAVDKAAVQVREVTKDQVAISGGTFSSNVSEYLAPTAVMGEGNTVRPRTEDDEDAVVEMDGAYYNSLQAAVDVANFDGIVTLLKETSIANGVNGLKVWDDCNITLNLNGQTLYGAVWNYGTLTITGNGTISNTKNENYWPAVENYGMLTVENGTYTAKEGNFSLVGYENGSDITIEGGTFRGVGNDGGRILIKNGVFNAHTLYIEEESFAQHTAGLANWFGSVTIENGTFSSEGTEAGAYPISNEDEMIIKGGTVQSDITCIGTQDPEDGTGRKGNLSIMGGNFTGRIEHWNFTAPEITGGTFNTDPTEFVPAGYKVTEADENTWTVSLDTEYWAAEVGGEYFVTLQAAIDAAEDGETVKLLKDTSGSGVIVNKSITIDFDGKTYTVGQAPLAGSGEKYATQAFQLLAGADKANPNTVTMQNGTIVMPSTTPDLQMGIQNYTNLTLSNMKLDASDNENIAYVVSNNNGTTTITDGTVIKAAEGKVAFDVYDYSANGYPTVKVSVDNADITGKIEVSASEKATLEVSGGTFSMDVNDYCVVGKTTVKQTADGKFRVIDAGELKGTVTAYGDGKVDGNTVTFDGDNALVYVAEADEAQGRPANHWWAGIKVTAPAGIDTGKATYQKIGEWWNDDGSADDWTDASAIESDGQYWAIVRPVYMNQFKGDDNQLMYRYSFDWNGDGTPDQEVTIIVTDDVKYAAHEHMHAENDTGDVTPATCVDDGYTTYTCVLCGDEFKADVVKAEGHKLTATAAKAATCTEAGNNEYWTCSNCDKVFKDEAGTTETTVADETIGATGHSMTKTEAKAATCTEAGNNEYWTCSECNKVFKDEAGTTETTVVAETIEALGHSMTHHDEVAPTLTTRGTIEYWSCDRCKLNFSDEEGATVVTDVTSAELFQPTVAITADNTALTGRGTVTLTVTADEGAEVTVSCDNESIVITNNGNGTYTATLPNTTANYTFTASIAATETAYAASQTVTVSVTASTGGGGTGGTGGTGGGITNIDDEDVPLASVLPFDDVAESDWYYEDVKYVYDNELMSGTSDSTFSPYMDTTRGMIVTILYRIAEGNVTAEEIFDDVDTTSWYSEAVTWGTKNDVIAGYGNGLFGPNDKITREQLVSILWRYMGKPAAQDAALPFSDADQISDYAREAMQWALEQGIISGKSETILDPRGHATRAETAAILSRYLKLAEAEK